MKITKGLIGASALAAALAISPAAFAQCSGFSRGASNSGPNNQMENGWQSSSTGPSQAGNWQGGPGGFHSGMTERYFQLAHEANRAIDHDPELRDQNIHAWVNANGVVVLRGEADSASQAMRAQHVIAQYTGLKNFDNELYYPHMFGGPMMRTTNENMQNQRGWGQNEAAEQNGENAQNENNENAQNENNENNENAENAENNQNGQNGQNSQNSQNNQNNGAASPSGPQMGQNQGGGNQGGNSQGGNGQGGNQ